MIFIEAQGTFHQYKIVAKLEQFVEADKLAVVNECNFGGPIHIKNNSVIYFF